MDHSVVVFEHVHFFNFIKRLHACFHKNSHRKQVVSLRLLTELLDSGLDLLVLLDLVSGAGRHLPLNSTLST